ADQGLVVADQDAGGHGGGLFGGRGEGGCTWDPPWGGGAGGRLGRVGGGPARRAAVPRRAGGAPAAGGPAGAGRGARAGGPARRGGGGGGWGWGGWADGSEYPAQFGQGLPPGGLDRAEGLAGLVRSGVEHITRRGGLHDDHAECVGDDVVEFTADPGLLF